MRTMPPPRAGVLDEQGVQDLHAVRIEGVERLVEQPDRRGAGQGQPRQGDPSPLALRQGPHRRVAAAGHADAGEGGGELDGVGRAAVEPAQEAQRLEGAQLLLQRVGMGEIERAHRLRIAAEDPAGFRAGQARQGAQQSRLALAVGAAEPDDGARLEAQVEAAEQRALAAPALQPFDGQERCGSFGGRAGHGKAGL